MRILCCKNITGAPQEGAPAPLLVAAVKALGEFAQSISGHDTMMRCCPRQPDAPQSYLEITGRDVETAVRTWNTRAATVAAFTVPA